jgi:hypothetical protein
LISQSIRTADRIVIAICGDGKSSQIAVFDDKSQFPRLADSVRVRSVDAYLGPASCRFTVKVSVGDDKGFAFLGASVDTILLDENLDFVRSGQPGDHYARLHYARLDEALGREIERMVGRTFLQMWEGTSNSAIDTIGGGESFTLHD